MHPHPRSFVWRFSRVAFLYGNLGGEATAGVGTVARHQSLSGDHHRDVLGVADMLHIKQARCLGGFRVEIEFSDGRCGVANLADALDGPVFEPLNDPVAFAQLRVDDELRTIVWPNGADLAPEYLYFEAFKHDPDLQQQFEEWGYLKRSPASA
jgi:hypothetical protein